MLHRKLNLLLQVISVIFSLFIFLILGQTSVSAAKSCHTEWRKYNCGKPWKCDKQVVVCDEDKPPKCVPIQLKCVTTCGYKGTCMANGCGGTVCCPATGACGPTSTPQIACVDSDGGNVPGISGRVTISAPALAQVLLDSCMILNVQTSGNTTSSQWVKQSTGTHVAEKTCTNTTTGAYADSIVACPYECNNGACNTTPVFCGAGRPPCPTGQECYQPPMPPCTQGGCIQSMPARYCRPLACPKRPQGDANCDQAINNADYDVYKSFLRGLGDDPNPNYSTDFNTDGKTNLVDYEIWRSNFSH